MKETIRCPRCGEADNLWLSGPKVNLFDGMVTLEFYCHSLECRKNAKFSMVFLNTSPREPHRNNTVTQEIFLK